MGLYERMQNDMLSDNTQSHICEQCETCVNWDINRSAFENAYNKSNCAKFPYPTSMKPIKVINNEEPCPMYEQRNPL